MDIHMLLVDYNLHLFLCFVPIMVRNATLHFPATKASVGVFPLGYPAQILMRHFLRTFICYQFIYGMRRRLVAAVKGEEGQPASRLDLTLCSMIQAQRQVSHS